MEENSKDLEPVYESSSMVEIEKSRAVQEVQASLVIAQKFPRDLPKVIEKISES